MPAAQPIENQIIDEDSSWVFQVPAAVFTDAEDDALVFVATLADGGALPDWISFDPLTRTFSGEPPQDYNGKISIRVSASDGAETVSSEFTLDITPVNDAPTAGPIISQRIVEDTAFLIRIPLGVFADVDGDALVFAAKLTDGSELPIWLEFDPVTLSFSGTPPNNYNGSVSVRVSVSDAVYTESSDFILVIDAVNDAPTLNSVPVSLMPRSDEVPWFQYDSLGAELKELSLHTSEGVKILTSRGPFWVDPNHHSPGAGYLNLLAITYSAPFGGVLPVISLLGFDVSLKADLSELVLPSGAHVHFWFQAIDPKIPGVAKTVNYALKLKIDEISGSGLINVDLNLSTDDSDWIALFSNPDRTSTYARSKTIEDALRGELINFGFIVLLGNEIIGSTTGNAYFSDMSLVPSDIPSIRYRGDDTLVSLGIAASVADVDSDISDIKIKMNLSLSSIGYIDIKLWEGAVESNEEIVENGKILATIIRNKIEKSIEIKFTENATTEFVSKIISSLSYSAPPSSSSTDRIFVSIYDDEGANSTREFLVWQPYIPETDKEFVIDGGAGDDFLHGGYFNDILSGYAGSDRLYGHAGSDRMSGGAGDDLYFVDDAGDLTVEADGEGFDRIITTVSYSLAAGSSIEVLEVQNAADTTAINLAGNEFANVIIGNAGANALEGGGGDDVLLGYEGADSLLGGAGNDSLLGGTGDDTLDGGAGNDRLDGGTGSDVARFRGLSSGYQILTSNGSTVIIDIQPDIDGNDGEDTIVNIDQLMFRDGKVVNIVSPIILDLDGKGVETLTAAESHSGFDIDGDGIGDDTSWFGPSDGMLFLDRDGNGTVSDAREFNFVNDLVGARSDLEGLVAFDSNKDGLLSSLDAQFTEFKLWQDLDGNGIAELSEILSLNQAGIFSINLTGTAVNSKFQFGDSVIVNKGNYTRIDGSTREFLDVALTSLSLDADMAKNSAGSPYVFSETKQFFIRETAKANLNSEEVLAVCPNNFLGPALVLEGIASSGINGIADAGMVDDLVPHLWIDCEYLDGTLQMPRVVQFPSDHTWDFDAIDQAPASAQPPIFAASTVAHTCDAAQFHTDAFLWQLYENMFSYGIQSDSSVQVSPTIFIL